MKAASAKSRSKSKFASPLLDAAQTFFTESLRYNERHKYNLAIVQAYTAVELMLKARLCLIHDALRSESLNDKSKGRTIKWGELAYRLDMCGIRLSQDELELMKTVSDWRNNIVHCLPLHDESSAAARLPQLFEFLSDFSKRELGNDKRLITMSERRQILVAKRHALAGQRSARLAAKREGSPIHLKCPICGLHGTVCQRDSARTNAYCHYCKRDLMWGICEYCEKKFLSTHINNLKFFHSKCAMKADRAEFEELEEKGEFQGDYAD